MNDQHMARTIRAKKLGVLIREARQSAGKTVDECAGHLGIAAEDLDAYEFGRQTPSLPELESLALLVGVPVAHFLGEQTLAAQGMARRGVSGEQARLAHTLRQRIIGARLRQARLEKGLALSELAGQTGLEEAQIEAYELALAPAAMTDLQDLAAALELPLGAFSTHVEAALERAPAADSGLDELPPDLRAFVMRPINRPYLEIAQRLSEMPADQLRAIAEGLLAITY